MFNRLQLFPLLLLHYALGVAVVCDVFHYLSRYQLGRRLVIVLVVASPAHSADVPSPLLHVSSPHTLPGVRWQMCTHEPTFEYTMDAHLMYSVP